MNHELLATIAQLADKKTTAKNALSIVFIENGYFPDQVVAELAPLLPEAYNGYNKDTVKLICNIIKLC